MQLDENKDQKNIKEMKERIKKYKDELRKVPPIEARHRLSFTKIEDPNSINAKKKHKGSVDMGSEMKDIKDLPKLPPKEEEEEDEDDDMDDFDMGDAGGDPKAKKMK